MYLVSSPSLISMRSLGFYDAQRWHKSYQKWPFHLPPTETPPFNIRVSFASQAQKMHLQQYFVPYRF